jgi:glycosyltransferase involved in cell wall biosynthesis
MTEASPKVLSIGYGRSLFVEGNPERVRMELCATETTSYRMIIFTSRKDNLSSVTEATYNLFLYPTNSRWRFLMPIDAFLLARRIIKTHGLDVVTTQDPFEAGIVGYALKLLYKTPLVIQEHGDVFSTSYWRRETLFNRVRYLWGLALLKRADVVRVVSLRMKEFYKKSGIRRITFLPVSVDTRPLLEAEPVSLREYFAPEDFVFLSVARFVPQKNLTLLIEAFARVQQEYPKARLLLVGTGKELAVLQEKARTLFGKAQTTVVFLPWSDNVAGLMKAADAYVLSSNYEGWGRVLIEAMVTGLPMVTTAVGCAGEVVRDGKHGLIVPIDDTEALAKAMLRLATDKDFYAKVKHNLAILSLTDIPGTDLQNYGKDWVKTLRAS